MDVSQVTLLVLREEGLSFFFLSVVQEGGVGKQVSQTLGLGPILSPSFFFFP